MAEIIPTGLAILAVAVFGVALYAMTIDRFAVAGASFLSASLLIFLRERHLQDEESGG